MKDKISIAIIDDQPLFRKGLIALFKPYRNIQVLFEAGDGNELMEHLETMQPEVLLLDLEMPGMDGIKATELVRNKFPGIRILVLTMHQDEAMVLHLIEKGAHGFLLKDTTIQEISDGIHSLIDNGYYFNDRVSKIMVSGLVKGRKIKPTFNKVKLSEREIEVINLMSKEYKNAEIAKMLFINVRTVDRHRENIMRKINVRNSIGIIMYAVKNDLLT
jgi:DNA-binding NarL/FixJ family response regulator